jgi:amidohydrolase
VLFNPGGPGHQFVAISSALVRLPVSVAPPKGVGVSFDSMMKIVGEQSEIRHSSCEGSLLHRPEKTIHGYGPNPLGTVHADRDDGEPGSGLSTRSKRRWRGEVRPELGGTTSLRATHAQADRASPCLDGMRFLQYRSWTALQVTPILDKRAASHCGAPIRLKGTFVSVVKILEDAREIHGDIVQLRHDLHRHPELGLELPRTQEKVLEALADLPLEITLGKGLSSVGAVLRGTGPTSETTAARSTVLLRADMDALPLQEETGVDFASAVAGRMHACGHDLHTSMLVGAARLLSERRNQLAGDVVFMFQPAEELLAGAPMMIAEGILELSGQRVDSAYGLHVFSAGGHTGRFETKPGVMMSAADALFVKVKGKGGHGSAPHLAKDPVPVMAEMILGLQHMVTRQFNAHDPVVISVGMVKAGEAINVIPDTAEFGASLRMYSAEARAKMQSAIPRLLEGIASAHGLDVDISYQVGGRVTVTDEAHTTFAAQQITELFGSERHHRLTSPLGGSEDFADVLSQVPGSFICLDATPLTAGPDAAFNHSPRAAFDDSVLVDGTALYTQLAVGQLSRLAGV